MAYQKSTSDLDSKNCSKQITLTSLAFLYRWLNYTGFALLVLVGPKGWLASVARAESPSPTRFGDYLKNANLAADGFELPKANTVTASGNGRVISLDPDSTLKTATIIIEHFYFENHRRHKVRSRYTHIRKPKVKLGDSVKRGQVIGSAGPKHRFEIQQATNSTPNNVSIDTEKFINSHRRLFMPSSEATLLLIDADSYRMRHYKKGKQVGEYEVAFGQAKGRKRLRGDNRSPRGMYFVTSKYRGKITGEYGAYYGGHWIKINYPNRYDAKWGAKHKKISSKTAGVMTKKWSQRKLTPQKTKLGGGIGFHGWIGSWKMTPSGAHLSWGCIVMHNQDIKALFDKIPESAMVVIF